MARKPDPSLLLILSEKEAQVLRHIIDIPPETASRPLWVKGLLLMLVAVLLIAGLSLGLLRPDLAATIAKWVALLRAL